MPEGDTVHKIAAYLREHLGGQTVTNCRLTGVDASDVTGATVSAIHSHGKHLYVECGSWTVRSHLGMHGSWHTYAPDEEWQKPRRQATVVFGTRERDYVCFNAHDVALIRTGGFAHRDLEQHLGPDLAADECDMRAILARAAEVAAGTAIIADVLLDQRIASGIGNVYKSEVLFLEGIHPATPLERITTEQRQALYASARRLLRANLGGGPRITRFTEDHENLWVYRRKGRPCFRCGSPIERARMGQHMRSTYWCGGCQ